MNSWSYDNSKLHKLCMNSGRKFGRSYGRHCKHHDSTKSKGLIYSPPSKPNSARYFFNIRPISHLVLCQRRAFPWSYWIKKLVCIFHVLQGYCKFRPSNSPRRKQSKSFSQDKLWSFSLCNFYYSPTAWRFRINAVIITFFSSAPQVLIHSTGTRPSMTSLKWPVNGHRWVSPVAAPFHWTRAASQGEAGHNSLWGPVL